MTENCIKEILTVIPFSLQMIPSMISGAETPIITASSVRNLTSSNTLPHHQN